MLAKALASASASAPKVYVEDVFSTWLYTGNGSTQTITNGIDLSGKGGLVWIKQRNGTQSNVWQDTARGNTKYLMSNATDAEYSVGSNYISSFNSDGFSLGSGSLSTNGNTYGTWTFRKAAKFFDVVTYTGNGTSGRSIAHALGSAPGMIIVKRTDASSNWKVFHRSNNVTLLLNSTTEADSATALSNGYLSTTGTTSFETYAFGGSITDVNASGGTYVAYLFAHDAGGFGDSGNDSVVKCGSYTGNGAADGQAIDLGWEPQWLIIKGSSVASNWQIIDTMRGATVATGGTRPLRADLSNAEYQGDLGYPYATGFVAGPSTNTNNSGSTYIYIAIRRGPMKTPTDATTVFNANVSSAASGTKITAGFAVDMHIAWERSISVNGVYDRLRGVGTTSTEVYQSLATYSTAAENTSTGFGSAGWDNTGFNMPAYAATLSHIFYSFRRAPGFSDVVAYKGTSNSLPQTISHNLGVKPEMMIVKRRDTTSAYGWHVWHSAYEVVSGLTSQYALLLNTTAAIAGDAGWWNQTSPTSTSFTVGDRANMLNGTFIAYLFASCPGVSKVGSYAGTGTTLNVDCGFTNGARFVLIKRTDSTGDWYAWDTARGIVSGNDPYLLLNSTAAEVTNTDYIDPLSSGFQISSTAPAAINANGGSFIFLAVA